MDRNERARRRALFARPWEAIDRDRSLAHGLELEAEAEQEEATHQPRRRFTGRSVAIATIVVFVVSSLGLAAVLADGYLAQAFLRDHGVVAQAVITDKTYTDRPHNGYSNTYALYFRFQPRPLAGRPAGPPQEEFDAVPASLYAGVNVGQVVSVRYNPERPSQSTLYLGPPPTDREIIVRDLALLGVWVGLFGGLCAVIVFVAWPERAPRAKRIPKPWAYR